MLRTAALLWPLVSAVPQQAEWVNKASWEAVPSAGPALCLWPVLPGQHGLAPVQGQLDRSPRFLRGSRSDTWF